MYIPNELSSVEGNNKNPIFISYSFILLFDIA